MTLLLNLSLPQFGDDIFGKVTYYRHAWTSPDFVDIHQVWFDAKRFTGGRSVDR